MGDRGNNDIRMNDRGPPPVTNSRFAAAAEADRDRSYNDERGNNEKRIENRGPPPVTNSRFAAAAAAAEADRDRSYNDAVDEGYNEGFNDRGYFGGDRRGYGDG